ncbi:glycosyltransferase [Flavobacterium oreochromis]|uniref:glycosyltransferase n=1 Tax=Flavobacterium oreochromis TaxID=2906078 RepID=UPI00385D6B30
MIDILLATYNGEKYIKSQIYSLLSQTYQDWRLLVHDDGSTDNTVGIIKGFQEVDQRIFLIEDGIQFGNAGLNFFHLMKFSDAKFLIFCDQDDIWLESKIELLMHVIENKDNSIPQMVFSGGYLYSSQKDIFQDFIETEKPKNIKEQLFLNAGLQGCSIIFNNKLNEMAKSFQGTLSMHDHLVTMIGITFGQISYLDRKLMLYRQNHVNKTTADISKKTIFQKIFVDNFPVIEEKHFTTNKDFYYTFENIMKAGNKELFNEYFKYKESKSKIKRLLIVFKNNFSLGGDFLKLSFKTIFRK